MPIGVYVRTEIHRKINSESHIGKKLPETQKKKIGDALRGEKSYLYGKHLSEITKKKLSDWRIGKKFSPLSNIHKKKIGDSNRGEKHYNYGKHLSELVRRRISESNSGEKAHQWKGGTTPVKEAIRGSFQYNNWRSQVFLRDDFTCQNPKCNQRGGKLHAHHIKPFSILLDEARSALPLFSLYDAAMLYTPFWDIKLGKTLCVECHKKIKHLVNYRPLIKR